jgi:hypothetical protein
MSHILLMLFGILLLGGQFVAVKIIGFTIQEKQVMLL